MTKYIYENGIEREATAEEEAAFDNEETTWANGALDRTLKTLRQKRNNLLKETDWTANSDVTMSSDMTTYRQALRDLPSGLDTVAKVNAKEFPTKP
tara:strand:- start:7 stop:294 length:288 start_codon:yes stop_codon:yes gene_type:complete